MKKAQLTINTLIWTLRILFVLIIILSLSMVVSRYINARIDTTSPEVAIFTYRILFDDFLLFKNKFTQRIYPLYSTEASLKSSENLFEQNPQYFGQDIGAKITVNTHTDTKRVFFYYPLIYQRLKAEEGTLFGVASLHAVSTYPLVTKGSIKIDVYKEK